MLKWLKRKATEMLDVFGDNDRKSELEKLRQEYIAHQDMLKSIAVVLSNPHGKKFIKYLLTSFDFGKYPAVGLRDQDLLEYTAFLRSGQSIYNMVLEAEPELTGQLITEMEKEQHYQTTKLLRYQLIFHGKEK